MDFFNQQFSRFNQQPQQKSLLQQTARFRYGFVAGIIVGVFFGWFFHGVVSLVIRLGLLVLLLIPIVIIAWLFLRSRSASGPDDAPQTQRRVFTIGNVPPFMRGPGTPEAEAEGAARRTRETEPVIDLNADDYDLEKFKKRLEQDN